MKLQKSRSSHLGLSNSSSPNKSIRGSKRRLVDVIQQSVSVRTSRQSDKSLRVRMPNASTDRPQTSSSTTRYQSHRKLLEPEVQLFKQIRPLEVSGCSAIQNHTQTTDSTFAETDRNKQFDISIPSAVVLEKNKRPCIHDELIGYLKKLYHCKTYIELLYKIRKSKLYVPVETKNKICQVSTRMVDSSTQTDPQPYGKLPGQLVDIIQDATNAQTMTEPLKIDDTLQLDLVLKNLRELLECKTMEDKAAQKLVTAANNLQFIVNEDGMTWHTPQNLGPVQVYEHAYKLVSDLKFQKYKVEKENEREQEKNRILQQTYDKLERETRNLRQIVINQKNDLIDFHTQAAQMRPKR